MDKNWNITDFYADDVPAYASYDNIRKIANYVDGLKNSMRKLVYTGFQKFPNEPMKTENFCNICAAFTNYLHGSANLCGVCETLSQKFVGSNNFPLFTGFGGFGTRINPTVSAPRYTKVQISPEAKKFFNKEDFNIVERQYFEGEWIEPQFFVPVLPVILLNGSEGLSTGFSQKILPRNPKDILKYIKAKLDGKESKVKLLPWYKGFNGTFRYNAEGKLEVTGCIERIHTTKYFITELPIFVSYTSYIDTLDKLVESKIIVDYIDKCDPKTDKILFEIKTTREFTKENNNTEKLLKTLKLIKNYSEIFNCIDTNNRIIEFSSAEDILDAFIDIRLKFYTKRKEFLLKSNIDLLNKLYSKFLFCAGVIKGEIVVNNKTKDKIIAQLEKNNKIIKVDGTYDYILNMPIYQLTREQMEKLKLQIQELKESIKIIKDKTIQTMWTEDIETLRLI